MSRCVFCGYKPVFGCLDCAFVRRKGRQQSEVVAELRAQIAALMAEVGTLRAKLRQNAPADTEPSPNV